MNSTMGRRPTRKADEVDVTSRWRHAIRWQRGEVAGIKRRMRRRERRTARAELRAHRA